MERQRKHYTVEERAIIAYEGLNESPDWEWVAEKLDRTESGVYSQYRKMVNNDRIALLKSSHNIDLSGTVYDKNSGRGQSSLSPWLFAIVGFLFVVAMLAVSYGCA